MKNGTQKKKQSTESNLLLTLRTNGIVSLPVEIMDIIFSFFSPKELSIAGAVCDQWRDIAKSRWQEDIRQDFPTLKKDKQYEEDPQALYISQYRPFVKALEEEKDQILWFQLRSSIKGQIARKGLETITTRRLNGIAALQGNDEACNSLKKVGKNDMFLYACRLGKLTSVKEYIEKNTVDLTLKGKGLCAAAKHGHLDIVMHLRANPSTNPIPQQTKSRAFNQAIVSGHLHIARYLLLYIDYSTAVEGISTAAENGQLEILQAIFDGLKAPQPKDRRHYTKLAFEKSVEKGHLETTKYLWKSKFLSRVARRGGFIIAAQAGDKPLVQYFLTTDFRRITDEDVKKCFCLTVDTPSNDKILNFIKTVPNIPALQLKHLLHTYVSQNDWESIKLIFTSQATNIDIDDKIFIFIKAFELPQQETAKHLTATFSTEDKGKLLEQAILTNNLNMVQFLVSQGLTAVQIEWGNTVAQLHCRFGIIRYFSLFLGSGQNHQYHNQYRM